MSLVVPRRSGAATTKMSKDTHAESPVKQIAAKPPPPPPRYLLIVAVVERMYSLDQELFEVTRENNLAEVRRLLSVGADVNAKDSSGWTSLLEASLRCHVQVVIELMEHGADVEANTIEGWTSLHWACMKGHWAVVNELLSPNDSNGATTSILGKRKSRGADTEAKDRNGYTPLHWASYKGHLAAVKALVSGGANILAVSDQGLLPIHKTISGRKSAVSKYLLQLMYATTRRLPLPVHQLLEDLTWIGDLNDRDAPPLRKVLRYNVLGTDDVVEILEYLVGRNPSLLSTRNQDGSLPLHVACRRGASFTIVQSLVNLYKASVKMTSQGDLPLFLACEIPEPSLDTIFLLMKLYPDLVYR
jgi:ankyrin repeat protein